MFNHEQKAREYRRMGNNCSTSLHNAFSEDVNLSKDFPAPRSIDGKCGALLTSLKILDETGNSDKKKEFEEKFIEKFGYAKCKELMTHERRCSDYIGESSKMLDEILNK